MGRFDDLSPADVLDTLREVAQDRPDYVYQTPNASEQCLYVHDVGTPSQSCGCLVAQVLVKHGVTLEELAEHEGNGAESVIRSLHLGLPIREAETRRFDDIPSNVRLFSSVLATAQNEQDSGETWGVAYDSAKEQYDRLY